MSKPHLTKDFWLGALRAEGDAFRAAVTGATSLDAPVPSCPEWTVGDLARHLAYVHGKVRRHVTRGVTERPEDWSGPPADAEPVSAWLDEYTELLAALDAVDPELP